MVYHTRPPSTTPSPKSAGCVEKRLTVHRSLCRPIAYLLVLFCGTLAKLYKKVGNSVTDRYGVHLLQYMLFATNASA